MPPIDPRLVKAKRFPVHAAVTICHLPEVKRLLTEDAEFHIVRKIPDLELGVLHSACSSRHGSLKIFIEIVKYLVEVRTYQIMNYLLYRNSDQICIIIFKRENSNLIFQKGAPINERDSLGQTALHYAVCHQNSLELVTVIAESGAQVDPDRQVIFQKFKK